MLIYDVWYKQPISDIDYCLLRADSGMARKFIVQTCRIFFSFGESSVYMSEIPQEWLFDPENKYFLTSLEDHRHFDADGLVGPHSRWTSTRA